MQKIWRKRIRCRNRQQGFSLIEMMIVVAIAAVIAAISMPSLLGMRARYKLRASATDVLSAMKRAQSEAVKRDARVALAFDAVAGTCTVFVDDNKDSIQNGTEQTVSTTTIQPGNSFNSITFPITNTPEFNSRGIPTNTCSPPGPAPPLPPCYVKVINPTNLALQYRVTLNTTGHAILQVSQDTGVTWK